MKKASAALTGFSVLLLSMLAGLVWSAESAPTKPDRKVANFSLPDPRTKAPVSLSDFKDKKCVVIVFLGTECPINNAFLPRLCQFHKQYADKGVQFLGINSNSQDTAAQVAAHAKKCEVPFPILKDDDNIVADQLGARRTPEAFVLDAERTIRYQGRIDDQFGVGYQRPQPTRSDLALAIDELLAGKPISQPATDVAGCLIGRVVKAHGEGAITYSKQIARIMQNRCQECHRPGQVAPMPLMTYESARSWSDTIREVVQEQRMPPWFADPKYGKYSNERCLSKEERDTLVTWIDRGCPKGDEKDLPKPREFTEGWTIGKPDLVLSMKDEFEVPAVAPRNGVPYQRFTVETNFTEDRWVTQAEARPGAPAVVHHILVYILPPDYKPLLGLLGARVLCGVAPGDTALMLQPGIAKKIPAGSKLVFEMHYTPNGKAQKDRSSVGLVFAKGPPEREAITIPVANHTFVIQPGDDNYKVESSFTFRDDSLILGFMPHMHLRGKDFLIEAIYPDGKSETILSVPHFNFGWQSSYRLAQPLKVPKGTKLHCVAHFDNSKKNLNNPDPAKTVIWGDQTWEEMMIGWTEFAYDRERK